MERVLLLGSMLLISCNAQLHTGVNATADATPGKQDGTHIDASSGVDSEPPLGNWTTPTKVPGASTAGTAEDDCTLNSTGTELYFAVPDPGIAGTPKQLWVMTRPTKNEAWGTPAKVPGINNTQTNESPRLSPDDNTLYWGRNGSIFMATRSGTGWTTPAPYASVNGNGYVKWMAVCGNYFMVSRAQPNGAGGTQQDLFDGTLGEAGAPVQTLNSAANEISTYLSPDCLTVYFASNRVAANQTDIYTAQRNTTADPWPQPTIVTDFGTATDNEDPYLSPDKRLFVFASVRNGAAAGDKDLYFSTR